MSWTIDDIKNSKVAHLNSHLTEKSYVKTQNSKGITSKSVKKSVVKIQKKSPQKDWLELNLQYLANEKCVELASEYKFHNERMWRFDWAFPSLKIAVEYEGLFSKKSRHTTIKGYQGDIEKYNAAVIAGWQIIRVTAKTYKTVIQQLNSLIS